MSRSNYLFLIYHVYIISFSSFFDLNLVLNSLILEGENKISITIYVLFTEPNISSLYKTFLFGSSKCPLLYITLFAIKHVESKETPNSSWNHSFIPG